MNLILTVTVNPAIDKTVSADRLVFEDRSYILSSTEAAGGRGLNASRVLHAFGANTLAIAPSGGEAGEQLHAYLSSNLYPFELVPIARGIRTNLIITDKQGLTVKLNEPGPELSPEELARMEKAVCQHLDKASWLLLCGSLPPGVSSAFYCRLIRAAKKRGVKTLVDTDAEVLQDALLEGPTAITPNQHEASRLLNKGLITRQHIRSAATRLLSMGSEWVLLSLGGRGAIGARNGQIVEAVPPSVDAVCPIGAGDALNAAFVWAISRNDDFADAVRWGVAAGTASAILPGIQFASLDQTRAIYEKVELRDLR
ncbi:MAG: 1-phosphofructokinase family hexose kinase [Acidobacteriia bacterium]|nr:1-phosphofructokinase family hexose kinase [Terriglobia bacterium]